MFIPAFSYIKKITVKYEFQILLCRELRIIEFGTGDFFYLFDCMKSRADIGNTIFKRKLF